MTEEDTFKKLKKPLFNDMVSILSAELNKGGYDNYLEYKTIIERTLDKHGWTVKEYDNRFLRMR